MNLTRLVVLADERLVGLGLASLLESHYAVQAHPAGQATATLTDHRADLVLWCGEHLDVSTATALVASLRVCVLARTASPDALQVLLAHPHTAVAVLARDAGLEVANVLGCIERLLAGRSVLERSQLECLVERHREPGSALDRLTTSEREVLELVAEGLRNAEIARRVSTSEKAIEKRVSSVFQKLELGRPGCQELDRRVTAARIFLTCRQQARHAKTRSPPRP